MSALATVTRAAIVTGSGSGIGAALCRRLAAPGTGILVHARENEEGCARVADEIVRSSAASTSWWRTPGSRSGDSSAS
jgi:NAD(P)-dependent dehydrogenase (short-subunit alcohol dehydrogenase family)